MTEPETEQGTYRGLPPAAPPPRDRALRQAAPWLVAGALLVAIAAGAGLGTAYLVANLRAAPSPDAAFMPSPTPTVTPTAAPTDEPTAMPTEAPPTPQPTEAPSAAPTAQPTPTGTPFEYTVLAGDSVSRIALRFGVTAEEIIALNELRNPNRIFPGQVLLIPASPAP